MENWRTHDWNLHHTLEAGDADFMSLFPCNSYESLRDVWLHCSNQPIYQYGQDLSNSVHFDRHIHATLNFKQNVIHNNNHWLIKSEISCFLLLFVLTLFITKFDDFKILNTLERLSIISPELWFLLKSRMPRDTNYLHLLCAFEPSRSLKVAGRLSNMPTRNISRSNMRFIEQTRFHKLKNRDKHVANIIWSAKITKIRIPCTFEE